MPGVRTLTAAIKRLFSESLVAANATPAANADKVLAYKNSDGSLRELSLWQVASLRHVAADTIPAATTIDISALDTDNDGSIVTVSGSAAIDTVTLAEGETRILAFTGTGTMVNGSSLIVPGKTLAYSAGDKVTVHGKSGGVVEVINIQKASAGPSRPPVFDVRTAVFTPVTISTALNNGDTLNGLTLATDDIILLAGQSTASQNGVYVVGVSPARHTLFDTYDSHIGVMFVATEGTDGNYGDVTNHAFVCRSSPGGILGTTSLQFDWLANNLARLPANALYGRFINAGLRFDSLNPSYPLLLTTSESFTAGRILAFNLGDANRTITFPSATHAADDTYKGTSLDGLTAGASLAQWDAVYLDGSSTWQKADANGSGTYPARGLAVAAYSSTNPAIILIRGTVRNDAWTWTPGGEIYLSTTSGGLTQTAPSASGDKVQQVGYALTADVAWFDFNSSYLEVA